MPSTVNQEKDGNLTGGHQKKSENMTKFASLLSKT